jgi:hypothetical protein
MPDDGQSPKPSNSKHSAVHLLDLRFDPKDRGSVHVFIQNASKLIPDSSQHRKNLISRDSYWSHPPFFSKLPTHVLGREPVIMCFSTFTLNCGKAGIATGYGLDSRGVGVRVPVGSRIFSSSHHPDRLWGPPNLLLSFPEDNAARAEADHSPPTCAEVKKIWIYTSTPPHAFMA